MQEPACPKCGGAVQVSESYCKTSYPCMHGAICLLCGEKFEVHGIGNEDRKHHGPYFVEGSMAMEAIVQRIMSRRKQCSG